MGNVYRIIQQEYLYPSRFPIVRVCFHHTAEFGDTQEKLHWNLFKELIDC